MNDRKPFISSRLTRPKFTWDKTARAGYLSLGNGSVAYTKPDASGTVNIDYDLTGNPVGIEIL